MKTRVTLTLDPGLVEQLLGAHAPHKNKAHLPFHSKWKGKLGLANKSGTRMDYLKEKYQLPIEDK